ncbi:hypothetical protein NK553_20170 [Pseudomonas sp. ZM23]|uniref:Uncharacterized protein n=1 Tax=Pseudomonas triclosanedens TaxID=2961893 RepID=A0ABY7A880_9PSED|nr:hypothetical protein [Pseudomonas triclosanedens]MCP8466275.1 hypothetical protein [Pseudomonas triclosanedens]MCP8471801.1 hypothetical protein [Pseudomonas triclosanedens]MCP8478496.1 hypothetical protein [Pseudomonas triclosanedens]WAI52308.1 hypothetical protein OU419_13980 [Pseudomonas triclosanedens]
MGWNDHQDVALIQQLRQLLAAQVLEADSRQEILARYLLDHGFAALSEEQQKQFREELLPLMEPTLETETEQRLDMQINDPGNEDPGSLIELDVNEGATPRR